MGLVNKIATAILAVLVILVLILGYYGFVPGVSNIMGSNNPRNLGVSYTDSDLNSANTKTMIIINELSDTVPDSDSIAFSQIQETSNTLTSSEVTALMNYHSDEWRNYPVEKIQVRIGSSGDVELSCVIRKDRLKGFADAMGYPEDIRAQVRPYINLVPVNPALYLEGSVEVDNGVVYLSLSKAELGRLSLPANYLSEGSMGLEAFFQDILDRPEIGLSNVSFSNGDVYFEGIYPHSVSVAPP